MPVIEDPAKRAADLIAEIRDGFGKPQRCFCTGACQISLDNCPALISASRSLNEQLENCARVQEEVFGHPDVAALVRAAKRGPNDLDAHGFNAEARPLCPFCSKPFGDEMIDAFFGASDSYDSGPEGYGHVDITCDGCGRTVYHKEHG